MTVVRLFAAAAEAAGHKELQADADTLATLKELLLHEHAALAPVLPRCSYLVDGLAVSRDGDADLSQAGTVDVLPPFAGG